MNFVSFHALLMRLMLLDQHELVETGALPANDPALLNRRRLWQLGTPSTDAVPSK